MIPHTQGGRIQIIPYKKHTSRNITHTLKHSKNVIIPPHSNATLSNTKTRLPHQKHYATNILSLDEIIRPDKPNKVSESNTAYQVNKLDDYNVRNRK